MKHFCTAILMLAISFCATAQVFHSLAVNLNDGSKVEIELTEELYATFTDEDFVVSGGQTDITIPRTSIVSFSFLEELSAVDKVEAEGAPLVSGGKMSFTDLPEGTVIAVYNLAGTLLFSDKAGGNYTLDLSVLGTTPVIVKVNEVAYKIATK